MYIYAETAVVVALFVLIFLESKNKRNLLIPTNPVCKYRLVLLFPNRDSLQPPAYESTLSILVKPFFPHIVPLLYIGSKRPIKLPELREIPLYLRAEPATEKLMAALATGDKGSSRYLVYSTFRAVGGKLLGPVGPRLFLLGGTFGMLACWCSSPN